MLVGQVLGRVVRLPQEQVDQHGEHTTEATTENTIMSRHPGQPPNGRICTRPDLMCSLLLMGHVTDHRDWR